MNRERRDDILSQIAAGRAKQARYNSVLTSLPEWTDRPFRDDQAKVDEAFKAFQAADPLVTAVESRLGTEPGPVWRDFTPDERAAFANWTASLDTLQHYVDLYFPTDQQKRIMEYVCFGIALVSFTLPLFLDGESELRFPFVPKPVPLPPGMKPKALTPAGLPQRPVFRPSIAPERQAFSPTSFSRIPAATTPSGAIPVKAEIMRPAASSAPWRGGSSAPAGALPSPGFRSFVRPLGPSEPISARAVEAVASGTPVSQTPGPSPRIYPKPQFRRQ